MWLMMRVCVAESLEREGAGADMVGGVREVVWILGWSGGKSRRRLGVGNLDMMMAGVVCRCGL